MIDIKPKFQKTLGFSHFPKVPDGYVWILAWYGRVVMSHVEQRLHIEAFFATAPDETYNLEKWNRQEIQLVRFPVEKTILFPLGSVFNHRGKFLRAPIPRATNNLLFLEGITFKPSSAHRSTQIYTQLAKTKYPLVSLKDDSEPYKHCPFYYTEQERDGVIIKVIIPSHVILKYFYQASSFTIYCLVRNLFFDGLKDFCFDQDKRIGMVRYDGRMIKNFPDLIRDAGKYLFTSDNSGMEALRMLCSAHHIHFENERKLGKQGRSYLGSKIPFDFESVFSFTGQYITDVDSFQTRKFLAYSINSMRPKDLATKPYSVDKIYYDDISANPRRVAGVEIGSRVNIRPFDYGGDHQKEIMYFGSISNSSIPMVEVEEVGYGGYGDTPEFIPVDSDQSEGSRNEINILDALIVDSYSTNYGNTNSVSTSQRLNFRVSNDEMLSYRIFKKAMKKLDAMGFSTRRMHKLDYIATVGTKFVDDLVVFELQYNCCYYYMVEAGFGKFIPIIRMAKATTQMHQKFLKGIIFRAVDEFHFEWSKIADKKPFKNVIILTPNRHAKKLISEDDWQLDEDWCSDKLAEKTSAKIIRDYNSYRKSLNQ